MRTTLYTALAILSLSAGTAFAGGEQYPANLPNHPVVAQQVLNPTGSEGVPSFGRPTATVMAGGVEMPNASEQIVQSANSMPLGFLEGTASHAYAQSVERYFAEQTQRRYARQHGQ